MKRVYQNMYFMHLYLLHIPLHIYIHMKLYCSSRYNWEKALTSRLSGLLPSIYCCIMCLSHFSNDNCTVISRLRRLLLTIFGSARNKISYYAIKFVLQFRQGLKIILKIFASITKWNIFDSTLVHGLNQGTRVMGREIVKWMT